MGEAVRAGRWHTAYFCLLAADGWGVPSGAMHVVMVSSDHHSESDPWMCHGCTETQTAFLEKDLSLADKPENRKLRPWIIVVMHRPTYNAGSKGQWSVAFTLLVGGPYLCKTARKKRCLSEAVSISPSSSII